MPALNNKTKAQLLVVIVWLSFTIVAFAYFISDKLVDFDAESKLIDINNQRLALSLRPYVVGLIEDQEEAILHFSNQDCHCQMFSEKHIEDINKIAIANNFNVNNIIVKQHDIIPATPSIAILDKLGDIIYFGPYGEGLACSETSGYAQTILNNYLKGYSANLVVKQAKGCYCST